MIFEYLKRLLKKWFVYLIFVPDLTDLIQSHLEYTIPVSSNILNIFALFALLYATYQVWNDMRLEKLVLEEKLKNPIDYEVKAILKKVKIDLDYIENFIDENIKKSESLVNLANQELEKLLYNNGNIDLTMKMINKTTQIHSSGILSYEQSEIIYKKDLKNYIKELMNYKDNKNDYLLKWKSFIESELGNIYIVDFYITNIGRQSDEDIDIEIHFNNENRYIRKDYLLDNSPNSIDLPIKPKKKKQIDFPQREIFNEFDAHKLFRLEADSNPQTYKRYEEIEEKMFSIKLRDLKVSETVSIFRNNGYFIKIADKIDIDVSLTSKNSTAKINKKLVYKDDGEFDYFQNNE